MKKPLARRGITAEARLLALLDQTAVDESARGRIREQIDSD
jgi:hypothetical protein